MGNEQWYEWYGEAPRRVSCIPQGNPKKCDFSFGYGESVKEMRGTVKHLGDRAIHTRPALTSFLSNESSIATQRSQDTRTPTWYR